ncbi:guanine-1-methyltransferase-domain-containing protein [Globomyces pollinis-pini]|nr:guanine-1-methyltransferase-domain-containing protein [Globomyces pollinis-pini]
MESELIDSKEVDVHQIEDANKKRKVLDGPIDKPIDTDQNIKNNQSNIEKFGMSKKQYKRMKKNEEFQQKKELLKQNRKEEKAKKNERKKTKVNDSNDKISTPKVVQKESGIKVLIDLNFDTYMTEKELKSTATQLLECYSENKKSKYPLGLSLYASSLTDLMHKTLSNLTDYQNWKKFVTFSKHFSELSSTDFKLEDCTQKYCYLTADSPNVIESLEKDTIYIVGGIVDKNRHKGLCYAEAQKHSVSHGRLPISEFIHLSSRKVLTINHVVAIMTNYVNNGDWKSSFLNVLPERKLASAKDIEPVQSSLPAEINSTGGITSNEAVELENKS